MSKCDRCDQDLGCMAEPVDCGSPDPLCPTWGTHGDLWNGDEDLSRELYEADVARERVCIEILGQIPVPASEVAHVTGLQLPRVQRALTMLVRDGRAVEPTPGRYATKPEDRLDVLLAASQDYEMTDAEREEQRRSFAYGNAKIDNDAVTREMVDEAAGQTIRLTCPPTTTAT